MCTNTKLLLNVAQYPEEYAKTEVGLNFAHLMSHGTGVSKLTCLSRYI